MRVVIRFGTGICHPFFPDFTATPVVDASGECVALSGSLPQLMDAPLSARATRAVFVLRYPENPFLRDADRDALWTRFQVPVFSILVGGRGKLLAYECETQTGLHVGINCLAGSNWVLFFDAGEKDATRPASTVSAKVESTQCECGRKGYRLVPPRGLVPENRRHAVTAPLAR